MSFFDDMLPVIGGIGGFALGGPAGAAIGAGAGGKLSSLTRGSPDNPYDKLTYVGPQPGQGLTAEDQFAMERARRSANQTATGNQGALEQRMATQGGSASHPGAMWSLSQQAGQDAIGRNSLFDLGRAGIAANRDAANRMALNDFNMKHTMLKADYDERAFAADSANRDNLFDSLGSFGMYNMYGSKRRPGGGDVNSAWEGINAAGGLPGIGTGM